MKEYLVKVQIDENASPIKSNIDETERNINKSDNTTPELPSSKILLSIVQKEYDYDMQNIASLYSRTGIMIAFTGVFLNLVSTNFNNTLSKYAEAIVVPKYLNMYTIMSLVTMGLGFVAIILFAVAIFAKKFERIIIGEAFNESTMSKNENHVAKELVKAYKKVMNKNQKIVNRKNRIYIGGLVFLLIAIFLYISSIIIRYFLF